MWNVTWKVFSTLVCIDSHMIIHVKSLWHINVHWLTYDDVCEKTLPFYYTCGIIWGAMGAMWCVNFKKFLI
jgi:hypothetical protein